MKAFEEWNENFEGEPPPPIEPGLDCGDCYGYYKKEAWKAALEWIQEMYVTKSEFWVRHWIKNELE